MTAWKVLVIAWATFSVGFVIGAWWSDANH
jgi:hypothetical protein